MARLILLLAIGLAGWIIYQRLKATPPARRKSAYLKLGLGLLVVIVVIGVVTGRMHWLGADQGHGRQRLPAWLHQQRGTASTGTGGGNSEVETSILKMVLDHETGDLRGEVLDGQFSGRQLDDMDRPELETLLDYCRAQDTDSARLLESYLQRRFGGDWGSERKDGAALGLDEGAGREQIIEAHRKLMQKLHPDRGGNDYLAAKLNEAKDFLLR